MKARVAPPKTKISTGIGLKLKQELERVGIAHKVAAKACDIHAATISDIIHEVVTLSPLNAARLSRIGIDGRALYLEQASNKLRWYEDREQVACELRSAD